jgi:citronellol/citronellal dehydrogenase
MAKFAMSLAVLGLAVEFRGRVAVNALWPRTTIATSAIRFIVGGEETMERSRTPEILADAAHLILTRDKSFSGHFLIDDTFLAENGITDFDRYRFDPSRDLQPDFFVPNDSVPPAPLRSKRTP